ncbi:hypothetical protein AAHB64_00485 [Bacillus toyonensis]
MRKVESIVPEYLLEKFAEKGSEKAQKSLEHTKKFMRKERV